MNHGDKEMAALVIAVDGDLDFELSLGEFVGRWLKRKEQAIRDMEAATLLPKCGAHSAATRLRCHRSTIYRRVSRAAKVARQIPGATK